MQVLTLSPTAVNRSSFVACAFDQDAPHRRGGRRKEVPAVVPVLLLGLFPDQTQVRLMNQCRGLESLPGLFLSQFHRRKPTEFLVNQGQQLRRSVRIPLLQGIQNASNFIHR